MNTKELDTKTVRELYKIAKEKKIACYKTLPKAELVDAIINHKDDIITYLKSEQVSKLRVVARTCKILKIETYKKLELCEKLDKYFKNNKDSLKDVKALFVVKK